MQGLDLEQRELCQQAIRTLSACWAESTLKLTPAAAMLVLTTLTASVAVSIATLLGQREAMDSKALGALITDMVDDMRVEIAKKDKANGAQ